MHNAAGESVRPVRSAGMLSAPNGVRFSPPAGLEDRTTYRFADAAGRETVDVGYGSLPNNLDTAEEVLAERIEEIEQLKERAPDFVVDPQEDARVGPLIGRMFSYSGSQGHYRFREWIAIALLDTSSYVQIAYESSALDQRAPRKLRHILDSVAFAEPHPASGDAGFIRHQAVRISLDIPEKLDPPWAYSFVSEDDQTRIELSVCDLTNPSRRPPLPDDPTGASPPGTQAAGHERTNVIIGDSSVIVLRYVLTRQVKGTPANFAMYRADLPVSGGITVVVTGRAPEEAEAALRSSYMQILQSIQVLE